MKNKSEPSECKRKQSNHSLGRGRHRAQDSCRLSYDTNFGEELRREQRSVGSQCSKDEKRGHAKAQPQMHRIHRGGRSRAEWMAEQRMVGFVSVTTSPDKLSHAHNPRLRGP
eukprot:6173600-Pleurochrysis_carterae.AAC.1